MLLAGAGAGDTVRLDPTMTAVAPTEVGPRKVPPATSIWPLEFARTLRGRAALVALGIVIFVLFLGLLLGGVFSSAPRNVASNSSSTTSTSKTTTTLAPPTVASVAGSIVTALNLGVTNGTVAPHTGQQLDNQLQPLLFSAQPEPAAQQVQQFDQLVQSYDQNVANGQITGTSRTRLRRDLRRLAAALGTTVPTATTTPAPPPSGPKGKGPKGPGKKH